MSNHTDTSNDNHNASSNRSGRIDPGLALGGESFDDMADRAGRELRRPAPLSGLDHVHRTYRRRRATAALAGGAAALLLVAGGVWLGTRGDEITTSDTPPAATTDTPADPTAVTPSSVIGQVPTAGEPPANTTEPAAAVTDTVVEEAVPTASEPPAAEPPVVEPLVPPSEVSNEVLPNPLGFAADGVQRELVGRDLIVRSSPERVIPLDLPEAEIFFYGVGPSGVAYLRAEGDGLTRIVGVPTTGPNTGTVYELVPPYQHEGPWLGSMTPNGVVSGDLFSDTIATYIDPDGQPIPQSFDPTFTWWLEYRPVDGDPSQQRIVAYDDATRTEFEVPEFETTREGQGTTAVRPLPDGRIRVVVGRADGTQVVWALTPSTGVWTQHPAG